MNKTVMEKIDFGLLLTPFIHRINFYMIFTVFGEKKYSCRGFIYKIITKTKNVCHSIHPLDEHNKRKTAKSHARIH